MPADFIPARVCILICEIILTLPPHKDNNQMTVRNMTKVQQSTLIAALWLMTRKAKYIKELKFAVFCIILI